MTPLRIGIVCPPWLPVPPPAYGGIENVVDSLARGLLARGHEVVLFTTGDSSCRVHTDWVYERAQAARIHDVGVEARHLVHAHAALADCDVVHDHTVLGPLLAAAAGDDRVVATCHGPFDAEALDIYRRVTERVPLVAISHHHAATAVGIPISRVIHHGVYPAAYPIGAGGGGYALFLGRMSPTKGVDVAVHAARRAGVPLLIAAKMAEPEERSYFEAGVRPLLGGDVEFLGEVGGTDKVALLGGASVLLNPIQWPEPFGMVMIEAMACGTPVVTTRRGSAPEIVDDGLTGFVCDSPEDLAAALGRVGELDRASCRQSVATRFSADRMVEEHLELYREVVGGSNPDGHDFVGSSSSSGVGLGTEGGLVPTECATEGDGGRNGAVGITPGGLVG